MHNVVILWYNDADEWQEGAPVVAGIDTQSELLLGKAEA
jgi:hypothetical protein